MKKRLAQKGMGILELAEAAVHAIRLSPISTLTPYFVGVSPSVLMLLYFWSDMLYGASAWKRTAIEALGVTLCFIWMKCWQAVYCAKLRAALAEVDTGKWSVGRIWRLVAGQTFLQSTSFVLLPLAAAAMIPFGHVYAFYCNATVFGGGRRQCLGRRYAARVDGSEALAGAEL